MEHPQAGDASAGKGLASNLAATGSTRLTPGWHSSPGHSYFDGSRPALTATHNTVPFAGNTNATTQGPDAAAAAAAAAGNLLDPLSTQLTPDQLAAMLSSGAYAGLGTLGGAGLQGSDNSAAALNALLLGGGLNLNQLAASNLQLAGLGADLSALGAVLGGDMGEQEDYGGGGGKGGGLNVTSNKQLSSRFR